MATFTIQVLGNTNPKASVTGRVFGNPTNDSGIYTQGESVLIDDFGVTLHETSGGITNGSTNESGWYTFDNLDPGEYYIQMDTNFPEGYNWFVFKGEGEDDLRDSDVGRTTGTSDVFLIEGTETIRIDAGLGRSDR